MGPAPATRASAAWPAPTATISARRGRRAGLPAELDKLPERLRRAGPGEPLAQRDACRARRFAEYDAVRTSSCAGTVPRAILLSTPMTDQAVAEGLTAGKREQTKLANRRAILDAARQVFGELGYEAATVRDIIRRTNLSVGRLLQLLPLQGGGVRGAGRRRRAPLPADPAGRSTKRPTDFDSLHPRRDRGPITTSSSTRTPSGASEPRRAIRHPHVHARRPRCRRCSSRCAGRSADVLERGLAPAGRPRLPGRRLHRHRPRGRRADAGAAADRRRRRRPSSPSR